MELADLARVDRFSISRVLAVLEDKRPTQTCPLFESGQENSGTQPGYMRNFFAKTFEGVSKKERVIRMRVLNSVKKNLLKTEQNGGRHENRHGKNTTAAGTLGA